MTALIATSWRTANQIAGRARVPWPLGVLTVGLALILADTPAGELARRTVADAALGLLALMVAALVVLATPSRPRAGLRRASLWGVVFLGVASVLIVA
ncbi:hypothetical protein [Pararhodospirillum oryzae]|uniref:Uncharacterized protein n=1 Tax=Pararhodospirillum oryzae TaxID=478448 RepID=A0A512H6I2_9PROT|nr:hypothetical protein [Pararhodospirillum oryzae]GEO81000.1 hypothetical protein ROR02_11310 [Pararhodospirillum oryzae]